MSMSMTKRQRHALDFIKGYMAENGGVSPSYEEISLAMGLASKSGAHRLLAGLEERGHISRIPNRNRCIRLVEANPLGGFSTQALRDELARRGFLA